MKIYLKDGILLAREEQGDLYRDQATLNLKVNSIWAFYLREEEADHELT